MRERLAAHDLSASTVEERLQPYYDDPSFEPF